MATNRLRNSLLLAIVWLCSCGATNSADPTGDSHRADSLFMAQFDFVDQSANTIFDPSGSLAPFFAALDSIKSGGATVPIIHFGDSHIQGGSLTAVVMRRFARDYGTAGRGFITPHRLTGKNEPRDYSITASPSSKSGTTIIDSESRSMKIGISGVAAPCPTNGELTIKYLTQDQDKTDFRFRRIIAFHDSLAPIISVANAYLVDDAGGSDIFNSFSTELNLLSLTDEVTLRTSPEGEFAKGALYGFSLENGEPGVIYHSIGVNGACFLHWGRQSEVAAQSAAMMPRLIIISLGSNEASGTNFIESVFAEQIDNFVGPLRAANPSVPILLVAPPEAMRRRGRALSPNTNFELVSKAMKNYATNHNVAFLDLYQATSAAGSAERWKKANLLGGDGIHYTVDGYALQGLLLYQAIQDEANKYRNQQQ